MKKLLILLLLLCISIFFVLACQRVIPIEGELKTIKLSNLKGVPFEYGSLISVTANDAYPGTAQLWFEDDDGTIRMALIEFTKKRRLHGSITVIPRD